MKIIIGSDHAGFDYKEKLKPWLEENFSGCKIEDLGPNRYNPTDDYPVYSFAVAEKTARSKDAAGIIIAKSGIGEVVAANKVRGVRAVSFMGRANRKYLQMSRIHDDTNVLCFGSDFVSLRAAKKAIKIWLGTKFEKGARHVRRLKEVSDYEKRNWKSG